MLTRTVLLIQDACILECIAATKYEESISHLGCYICRCISSPGTLARVPSLVTVATAAEVVVSTAMLVSMSSNVISLVSGGSSGILSLGRKAGCLSDSDSVPDGVDTGGLALLGLLRLAEDVSWLSGVCEGISGPSSSIRHNVGDRRQGRLRNGGRHLGLIGGLGVLGRLNGGGLFLGS